MKPGSSTGSEGNSDTTDEHMEDNPILTEHSTELLRKAHSSESLLKDSFMASNSSFLGVEETANAWKKHVFTVVGNQVKSYPVFDMRKTHRIETPKYFNINCSEYSQNALKTAVCKEFNVKSQMVDIIEEKGKKEEVALKTYVIISPETAQETCKTLLLEVFDGMENTGPQKIFCCRMPVKSTVSDLKKIVRCECEKKHLGLSIHGKVVEDNVCFQSEHVKNFDKVQVIFQKVIPLCFLHKPRPEMKLEFSLDVDITKSVFEVKKQFEQVFKDEIRKQQLGEGKTVQFCFQEKLLTNKQCLGILLRNNVRQEEIKVYFAPDDCICLNLRYQVGRKWKRKMLIVGRQISTMNLRFEISKHMGVDPKAVKLTFDSKLIEEHDDLSRILKERWVSGCSITAGVKKCKTLQIKNPSNGQIEAFEMYMLETVSKLKKNVAERFGLREIQMSLFCRETRMENNSPLQHYAIKNNMEITLVILERRLAFQLLELKSKRRQCVMVDDCTKIHIEDVLSFSARLFAHPLCCLGAVFKDTFLDRKATLAESKIQPGDTVIITRVDNSHTFEENVIDVFETNVDGFCTVCKGIVSGGLLHLHANRMAKVTQTKEDLHRHEYGHIPDGIYSCDDEACKAIYGAWNKKTPSECRMHTTGNIRKVLLPVLKRKEEFLQRARQLSKNKRPIFGNNETKTRQPPTFFLEPQVSLDTAKDPEIEYSLDEETGRKTVVGHTENKTVDSVEEGKHQSLSNIENIQYTLKSTVQDYETAGVNLSTKKENKKGEQQKTNAKQIKWEDLNETVLGTCMDDTCLRKCDSRLRQNIIVETSKARKQVGYSDSSQPVDEESQSSGCENGRSYLQKPEHLVVSGSNVTGNSDDEQIRTSHGEDCYCRKCAIFQQGTMCPYLQFRMQQARQRGRIHTLSEGEVTMRKICRRVPTLCFPQHQSYPAFTHLLSRNFKPNADIETAGITMELIDFVAKMVNTKWKQLMRKLGMDDAEMNAVEHNNRSAGLQELVTQALITWKKMKGMEASYLVLYDALKCIGLQSVVDTCMSGYHTA